MLTNEPDVKSVASSVETSDGYRLAVYDHGGLGAHTVVCVHGFPDDHATWDGLARELSPQLRVVSFDVRGSGRSDRPRHVRAYRVDQLAADIAAVIEHCSPNDPVHLVAHDWGAVAAWHAAASPECNARIGSLTSISGAYLDVVPRWARESLREGRTGWRALATMWKSPIYMGVFQLPVLAVALCRSGLVDWAIRQSERKYRGATPSGAWWRRARDNWPSIALYRANLIPRMLHPRPGAVTVPVQVLAPADDLFVSCDVQTGTAALAAPDLQIVKIDGSHWVPANDPAQIAGHITEFVLQQHNRHRKGNVR